jgi:hypothetical protein
MHPLRAYFRVYTRRKHVRPWSLSAPILVLLVALPLVQPFIRPGRTLSDEESSRYATIQAIVEQETFDVSGTQFASTSMKTRGLDMSYSTQPPTQAVLLAGPYWVMYHAGIRFKNNPLLVEYLLTVIGVTIPVALAAGMVYRMGRLFELRRPWRAGLAAAAVFGSGLISYATVLNPYAAAAALLLGAVAILVQVSLIRSPLRSGGYLTAAGFFTALAAAIDPAAVVFTVAFPLVILAQRWRPSLRFGGVLMYGIGLVPPILLHVTLSLPITGDWKLGVFPSKPVLLASASTIALPAPRTSTEPEDDGLTPPPTGWQTLWTYAARTAAAAVGSHGILSHFPVVILGLIGVGQVLRRHWPGTTKTLAAITIVAGAVVIVRYVLAPVDWRWGMFAMRWFELFLPLVVFWAGAWCRRSHAPFVWATAAVLLGISVVVSLIGAVDPMPRNGYDRYTPWGVVRAVRLGE